MATFPEYKIPMILSQGAKDLSLIDEKDEKDEEKNKQERECILEDINNRLNELFRELSTDEIHNMQIYLANSRTKIVDAKKSLSKLAIGDSPSNEEETFIRRALHNSQDVIKEQIIIFSVSEKLIDLATQISITVLQEKEGLSNSGDSVQLVMKSKQETPTGSNVTN